VDILSVTEHTPFLESLALTIMEPVSILFCPGVSRWFLESPFHR
jgi:hypothetical protein